MLYGQLELVRHLVRRVQPSEYGSGGVLPSLVTEFAEVFKLRPNSVVFEFCNFSNSFLDNGS